MRRGARIDRAAPNKSSEDGPHVTAVHPSRNRLRKVWQFPGAHQSPWECLGAAPTLVRSLSLTALTTAVVLIVNAGSGVAQARGLGPQLRGELAIAGLWPTLIAGLGSLGLREAVVYYVARETRPRTQVLATALVIGAVQALALAAISALMLPRILRGSPPGMLRETLFYLWFLPLYPLAMYPQAFFQAKTRLGIFNGLTLCLSVASTVILIVLWFTRHLTVHSALAAMLISYSVVAAMAFAILMTRRDWTWRPSFRWAGPLLWFGVRQQFSNVATLVMQLRLDLLALSLLAAPVAVGTYAVATSAGLVAGVLPIAASFVLYPAFARNDAAILPAAAARVVVVGGTLTLITGPCLVFLLAFAVPVVFGPSFVAAVHLTAFLATGYLLRGWNVLLASLIRGAGKPFIGSVGQGLEFVLLGGLLAALAPHFGAEGAAWAVLASSSVSFACLLGATFSTIGLSRAEFLNVWFQEMRRWRTPLSELQRLRASGLGS